MLGAELVLGMLDEKKSALGTKTVGTALTVGLTDGGISAIREILTVTLVFNSTVGTALTVGLADGSISAVWEVLTVAFVCRLVSISCARLGPS